MEMNGGFLVTKIKQLGDRIFEKILSEKNIDAFDWLTQDAIDLMMSHINSYPRARLNDESPFEVAEFLMGKQLLAKLNLQKIPAKDVILRPTLLKMYRIANLQQEPIHQ